MKRFCIALAALAASTFGASAADLPYKAAPAPIIAPAFSWTGFYVGANAGFGASYEDAAIWGTEPIARTIIGLGVIPNSVTPKERGWTFGGQLGYRWQFNSFVVGAEAEINWADINGSKTSVFTLSPLAIPASLTTTYSSSLDWYGTVSGTLGFALDRLLIYGKGGFAFGDVNNSVSHSLSTPIAALNATAVGASDTKNGYVLGGGLEYAFLQNWSLGVEYNYLNFGKTSAAYGTTVLNTGIGFATERDNIYHIVKGRLNYRF